MISTVRSFAAGMSTATNLTPLSRTARQTAAFRESRSSLAISSVAPETFARCSAFASSSRSAFRPLSTSVNRARTSAPREAAKSSVTFRCASSPSPLALCQAVETRSRATNRCPAAIFAPDTQLSNVGLAVLDTSVSRDDRTTGLDRTRKQTLIRYEPRSAVRPSRC